MAIEKPPHRAATARDPRLAHRYNHFVERQVRLLCDYCEQPFLMLLQPGFAAASRLGLTPPADLPALQPTHRNTDTHFELLSRLAARRTAFDAGNDAPTDILR